MDRTITPTLTNPPVLHSHLQHCFVGVCRIGEVETLEADVSSQLIRLEFAICADQSLSVQVFEHFPSSPH